MPTTRRRYQVTETADVERALAVAARRWPHESPSKLLLRLLQAGQASLEAEDDEAASRRRAALDRASGKYAGVFSTDHLADLRRDWPE